MWNCRYFLCGHVSVTYTLPSAMLFVRYTGARVRGHAVSKACGRGHVVSKARGHGLAVSKAAGSAGAGLDMVVPRP